MSYKSPFVIITSTDLKNCVAKYVNIKQGDYHVILGLTEDIYERHPNLAKVDAIKAYLMSQHEKYRLDYAMIVGNPNQVPTPMFYDDDTKEYAAYENYYCCRKDSVKPLFPLSRIPAANADEAKGMLDLAIRYHLNPDAVRKNICLTTDASTSGKNEYRQSSESVAGMIPDNFNVIKLYDNEVSKHELTETINKGVGFINYRGHGYCFSWASSIGLTIKDVKNLKADRGKPMVFSIACNTAAIHYHDNFAEIWMRNLKAIAFLGASSTTYRKINSEFNRHIWDAICNHGLTKAGDIFLHATLALCKSSSDSSEIAHNIKCYVLLGDPTADYKLAA